VPITCFSNISLLVNLREHSHPLRGGEMANLPCLPNAYLLVENDRIDSFGPMDTLSITTLEAGVETIDCTGRFVMPCWCDSHTHLVFAGTRENEMVDKIRGLSYAEINARGGGILQSAASVHTASEDDLFESAWQRLQSLARMGTGAIEIKSGYGLNLKDELKMLRVIRRLQISSPVLIRSTFLGAHAFPLEYRDDHSGYVRLIIEEMLPRIAEENLADFVDVFCEKGFFSPEQTTAICQAGRQYGLRPKLHVNQLHSVGGIETGLELKALSLDHLEILTEDEINVLGKASNDGWEGCCTLLPTAAFFLRTPMPPARLLASAGCALALASDCNPGSSPSGNMNLVLSMACLQLGMLPEEAINAATLNGAFAMGVEKEAGSITPGKKANLIITKPVPSLAYLPYAFGSQHIEKVMIGGHFFPD
jgi:imidazolonepropionase